MKIADISHYQGNIDWAQARKELELIIFRASVGSNKDQKYLEYTKECGIPYGAYHYVKAGTAEDARTEAKFFVECANAAVNKPLFYIADIEYETQTSTTTEAVCVAFLEELRTLGCKKIGLYINTKYKWAGAAIDLCDIMWIPHWGKNDGNIPAEEYKPKYYNDIWQYTSKGSVAGINGNVDLNILNGTKTLDYFIEREDPSKIPFTNLHFVEFVKKFEGRPYWYGTCVYACTSSTLASKTKQYPDYYTSSRTSKYQAAIAAHEVCADCVGLIKGYSWTNAGENVIESIGLETPLFKNKYASNGMPDKSANGMFEYAKAKGLDWGTIDTIPEIPGIAVRFDGHVGVYIGNGEVIEERGFAYGCVKTKLKDRKWLHWYKIPTIEYVSSDTTPIEPTVIKLGDRTLKKGMSGDDVKELQHQLNVLFNEKLTEDGIFGAKTYTAVRNFQSKSNLSIDGIYGAKSHAMLMSLISDRSETAQETDTKTEEQKIVLTTTDELNVRAGDSTAYAILTTVAANTELEPILNKEKSPIISQNGWYAVKAAEQIGWVSGKYIK